MEAIGVEDRGGGRRDASARLRRIAAATGVPIAAFFGAPAPRPLAELSELIGLWQSIADQEGRNAILAVARARAAGTKDGPGGPA
ncbi:hypothetical protein SAMN02799625_00275 [Methylobacterium sp. UNC300MFChir4.1]|uniref:hypothetical protein n=1 Tax=unclassified Methylobacterium TaxID=2615210 RepID=UPI0008A7588E|nr:MULTISPECIES: hypothetical protein [unclassified Methylobacterium]SEH39596.1 hypothetical protein SAMN02799636_02108 [Methylobacterium sp. 275MFSha3.1]SEM86085.1 hypothetical protein SAMN02799625_00275 [Methylobacterium sp. UNC300MFChir4.1]